MELITSRQGTPHITALQDAMWHRGIAGTESCVFLYFESFAATAISNNELRIDSGIGMLQGRYFCIEPNQSETVQIANGTQGENRTDLIVARIEVDTAAETETVSLVAIQGTPSTGQPETPTASTGVLDNADTVAEFPLYSISLEGIAVTAVTPLFSPIQGALGIVPQIGEIEINVSGVNPAVKYIGTTWVQFGAGKTLVGVDTNSSYFNTPQKTGGAVDATLPTHTHAQAAHTHTVSVQSANHEHTVAPVTVDVRTAGQHVHNATIMLKSGEVASGTAYSRVSSASGASGYDGIVEIASAGGHVHTALTREADTESENTNHRHTVSGGATTTGSAGSAGAGKNLQPYITVYFWLRTA